MDYEEKLVYRSANTIPIFLKQSEDDLRVIINISMNFLVVSPYVKDGSKSKKVLPKIVRSLQNANQDFDHEKYDKEKLEEHGLTGIELKSKLSISDKARKKFYADINQLTKFVEYTKKQFLTAKKWDVSEFPHSIGTIIRRGNKIVSSLRGSTDNLLDSLKSIFGSLKSVFPFLGLVEEAIDFIKIIIKELK